jgi:fructose-1,6-bisphosphatase/inositol monophosphatase family enzyme
MRPSETAVRQALHDAASEVRAALGALGDWGTAGTRPGQYKSDLAADAAAVAVLEAAGVGVMSEESGVHHGDRDVLVVVDPVDGSTNAHRRIPWYATSLCAVDADGPWLAVVVDQATCARYEATRGAGATVDGGPLAPSGCEDLGDAIVGLSGHPPRHLGWRQVRALGAIALDLCAVAGGRLDAYVDCSPSAHGPWDYLAGMLVCQEAGVPVVDAYDRDLVTVEHAARRTPLAAATPDLLRELVAARRSFADEEPWSEERHLLA